MLDKGVALGDFEGGPEAVLGAGGGGVGGADDDVAGEGVLLEEVIEGAVEAILGNLPGDEGALGEVGGEKGLADTPDGPSAEHGDDALNYCGHIEIGLMGNLGQRVGKKALDAILRNGKDAGVDGVCYMNGDRGC